MPFDANVWPAMIYPGATNPTGNGGTAAPPSAPPPVLPTADSEAFSFQAAAAAPNSTTYVNPNTTRNEIKTYFDISPLFDSSKPIVPQS
jgi:hypothetical protein